MTHKERMAALVEAGREIRDQGPFAVMNGKVFIGTFTINPDGRIATVEGDPTEAMVEGWPVWADFTCAAASARPSIALALEIVEAACELASEIDGNVKDLRQYEVYTRLDALLERWEGISP